MGARDRRRGVGGGVVIVVLLVAAAGLAVWWSNREPSPPGNVLLVGDSLFFQSADELTDMVESDGWTVDVQAGIGAGIEGGGLLPTEWVKYLRPIVEKEHPEVVIIELGTNGCGPSCEGIRQEIDQVLGTVKDADLVIWLTVRTAPGRGVAQAINREIAAAQDRWDNLEVGPMDKWFANRRDLLNPDGVHLNPAGQRHLAQHVLKILRAHTDRT